MNSSILFQHLILLATNGSLSKSECFKYELCSNPASLFEGSFIPLKPNKPDLLKAINKICSLQSDACQVPMPITDCFFVLDWGALVHKIPWQIGDKYCDDISPM